MNLKENIKNGITISPYTSLYNEYKLLDNFLKLGKSSIKNYQSSNMPFFKQTTEDNENTNKNENISKVIKLLEEYNIPTILKHLYKMLGNTNIEHYINRWTIMNLEEVIYRYKFLKDNNQNRVISFAHSYIGMGHCYVCSIDPEDNLLFIRRDGGSNGYDRIYNLEFIKKYKPIKKDKITFKEFIEIVENKTIPKNIIN